jgi:uncharacterized protein (DUF2252 family)
MATNVIQRICSFNEMRIPAMRSIKYRNMRLNPFTFFRGTSHLFYEDWPADCQLDDAPFTWVCGDLHLENYGTYKGANRQVYFDVNDFDDAALAQCTWDVTRLTTSMIIASNVLGIPVNEVNRLCILLLETYFQSLRKGNIHEVDQDNASGPVKKLMRVLRDRKRTEFLDEHSQKLKSERKFKLRENHLLSVSAQVYKQISEIVTRIGEREGKSEFYRIHDIAFRVAGNGSLGLNRYAVLIEGRGFPEHNFILDIKEERHSTLEPFLARPQPDWTNQAERVVTIQKYFQATATALLTTIKSGDRSFIIRELQPVQDRINIATWAGKPSQIEELCEMLANILAWGQLRSQGKQGSATVDDLLHFGQKTEYLTEILSYAQMYSKQVHNDYNIFASAYDSGKLE